MIIDKRLVEGIVEIGIQEIKRMNNGKIDYQINIELADTNATILSNKKDFIKKRLFRRKNNTMKFRLLYSNINSNDRELLKKILYTPNGISFQEIEYKYNIKEEIAIFIMAVFHELGHIFDMIDDVKKHKYLERDRLNSLQYIAYRLTMDFFKTREEQVREYKNLNREKFADELGIKMFKENIEKISILVNQFA